MKHFFQFLFVKKAENPWVQFFRYFFSGGSAFIVYFGLLYVFTEYAGLYHLTSLVVAYLISIVVNFLVSKYFVFSSHGERSSRQLAKFFSIALLGLLLQYCFVSLFTAFFVLNYLIANVIASALVYVVSFSLNRTFTFGKTS